MFMSHNLPVEIEDKTGVKNGNLVREFLDKYNLPYSLREDFKKSMLRLNEENVDIFLGNHMQQNDTSGKAERVSKGETNAFINPDEWCKFNLWCIENLNSMVEKENSIL